MYSPSGLGAPAAAWIDEKISVLRTGRSKVVPAGTFPGHWKRKGTRIPPSYICPFSPRNGRLLLVNSLVGPPLSLRKNNKVSFSRFSFSSFFKMSPTLSSRFESMAAKIRRCMSSICFNFSMYLSAACKGL